MLWEADKTTDDQQVYRFFWKLLSEIVYGKSRI